MTKKEVKDGEDNRQNILKSALALFSEKGYSRVSIRDISVVAGVSHGLIRHHFGNKQQIWQKCCELMLDEMVIFLKELKESFPENMPINEKLFDIIARVMAYNLVDPRPPRMATDAMAEGGELTAFFEEHIWTTEVRLSDYLYDGHREGYLKDTTVEELKWLMQTFTHAAATSQPLLLKVYDSELDKALLNHWWLFMRILSPQLGIKESQIYKPKKLNELMDLTVPTLVKAS